jgi:MFS family permease
LAHRPFVFRSHDARAFSGRTVPTSAYVRGIVIRNRYAILGLLTLLNLVNYLDRFVVNAVAPKIQVALSLSNAQLGAVKGMFMVGYVLTSPIFGWLGDRKPRKVLIAAGVAAWSLATAASGLASTLALMLLARAMVGVGEASYATLSPTIIDDVAPPERKNRWLAVFFVATPIGAALGFLFGGWVDHHWGWRAAFFLAGGPGLVLALSALLLEEPARATTKEARAASTSAAWRELARNRLYVFAVAGYVAQTFALGGFANWAVEFLYRRLDMELANADLAFGGVTVVTGLAGTAIGGWLADKWPGEDRARAAVKVCAWSSILAAPVALAALFMPSAVAFIAALAATQLVIFTSVAPTNTAVLLSVPATQRATAMAVTILAIHVLGDILSPILIGASADAFHDSPLRGSGGTGLLVGMVSLPIALAVSGALWWVGARERPAAATAS